MEDTLGDLNQVISHLLFNLVLILVLMEDTLGEFVPSTYTPVGRVLILVLMEDTLGGFKVLFI